jgi:hypothetical protein
MSMRKTDEKLDGRNKEGHERNLSEGQWEDRKKFESRSRTTYKNVLKPIYIG